MERLGNNSLKPCEICMGGSRTESCLDSISAEAANHCIKDQKYQEIIKHLDL